MEKKLNDIKKMNKIDTILKIFDFAIREVSHNSIDYKSNIERYRNKLKEIFYEDKENIYHVCCKSCGFEIDLSPFATKYPMITRCLRCDSENLIIELTV